MVRNRGTSQKTSFQKAEEIIAQRGGMIRTSEALRAGIHPETFYGMRDKGRTEEISRGLYRLKNLPPLKNPDWVIVSQRIPRGVFCLISALAFHQITTQIPHEVMISVESGSKIPKIDYPPIRAFQFGGKSFAVGVEEHIINGLPVRVYDVEKTIVDCFRFRNKIGLDVTIEALKMYREEKRTNIKKLFEYAEVCRMKNIIRPYLEALF